MCSNYQVFFENYAKALNAQRFEEIKACFKLPFILVHKEPQSVVSFDQQLEQKIKGLLIKLREQGIANLSCHFVNSVDVSTDMKFVVIEWTFRDEVGNTINQYVNSYILSEQEDGLKIVTLIVDDKHDLFIQLMR